jgi:plastocyanin
MNSTQITRAIAAFRPAALAATMLLSTVFTGCSEIEIGGGSSVVPTVTILPPDLSGDVVAGGGDTASAGGNTVVASAGGGPGTIKGRVVLTGTPPTMAPLFVAGADIKDKEVCAELDVPDERLILGTDNGVANVFVYLKKKPKGSPKLQPSEVAMVFDQKNCRFTPHCMIVPAGQTVKVLSDDGIAHNTHTNPAKNNGVSSLVSPNDREGELQLVYSRAEAPFSVTCDFHTWMKAYHMPLDHPYGAITDENGNFEIADIPAGDHVLVVWHESANRQKVVNDMKVTVQSGDNPPLEIQYSVDTLQL